MKLYGIGEEYDADCESLKQAWLDVRSHLEEQPGVMSGAVITLDAIMDLVLDQLEMAS